MYVDGIYDERICAQCRRMTAANPSGSAHPLPPPRVGRGGLEHAGWGSVGFYSTAFQAGVCNHEAWNDEPGCHVDDLLEVGRG